MTTRKAPLSVTPVALDRIKMLIESRGKPSAGIRVGVRTRGCSGNSYTLEFADMPHPFDEIVALDSIKIFIDPKAILFIVGTEMDFVQKEVESGFVFKNPNEKGRCGCGESFHV